MTMPARTKARPGTIGMKLPMRVWDGATRLFHWAIVLLVAIGYASISLAHGPRAALWMQIHLISGDTMLALLLFRLAWGVFGSDTARFARFLQSPMAVFRYLADFRRKQPDTQVGHSAAGGWMAVILLALLLLVVITGLFASNEVSPTAPLAQFVSNPTRDQLSALHGLAFSALAAVSALHVLAVAWCLGVKKQNLIRPMITGKKRLPAATPSPRMRSPWLAAATLAVAAVLALLVGRL